MKKITAILAIIIISCSKGDSPEEPIVLNDQNQITSFKLTINNETISGNIDQINKSITFNVVGADLTSLVPSVQYSDMAKLSPPKNESQNFNGEIIYNVFAENGDSNAYRVIVNNRPLGPENKIKAFSIFINNETIDATINDNLKLIIFNSGTFDITALIPSFTISEYATISPNTGVPQNFNNSVTYTVTAENGNIAQYKIITNPSKINGISTIAGTFTQNPTLLYVGAQIFIVGDFIDPNRPNAKLYLTDGINNYSLPILNSEMYSVNEYINEYNLYTKIPENVPTYGNYKIIYEANGFQSESESYVDILAENPPKHLSLNQDLYQVNDILIITGENLTDMIAIPSDGSVYLIQNSNNYDLSVNPERTEIKLTLDYYRLFPSYFGRGEEEKIITLLGPNRRVGETIKTVFN